jgi:hypothetical protein
MLMPETEKRQTPLSSRSWPTTHVRGWSERGKPDESRGRKATGPTWVSRATERSSSTACAVLVCTGLLAAVEGLDRKLDILMRSRRILVIVVAAGATILTLGPVGSASAADTGDTTATFTLAGGSLDVTPAAGAALTNGAPGAGSVSGSLGAVGVSDTSGSTVGWVLSAGSSTFVGDAGSVSTGVSYNSGAATASTGTVTPTTAGATSITAVAPVAAGTLANGNNTASYTPTLTVDLPASALAGDYEGTVTTSVL